MRRVCRAHSYPAASLSHRFARSPVDALVHLVVWNVLCCQAPIWASASTLTHLRVTVIPQRRSMSWRHLWWFRICPNVFECFPDVGTLRDERNQAHLPTAQWEKEREHLIDAGDQHGPQVVRGRYAETNDRYEEGGSQIPTTALGLYLSLSQRVSGDRTWPICHTTKNQSWRQMPTTPTNTQWN